MEPIEIRGIDAAKQAALATLKLHLPEHKYTTNARPLWGVTSVIDFLSGIDRVPEEFLAEARARGTLIHAITEKMDTEGHVPDPELLRRAGLLNYIQAWDAFKRDANPDIQAVETMVLHTKYNYAGTIDRVVKLDAWGDDLVVLDIKTGDPMPTYSLQTAAYQAAWNERRTDNQIRRRMAVYLKPNGKYGVTVYDNKNDWPAFVAALTLHAWRMG